MVNLEREKIQEVRSLPMIGVETGRVSNGTHFKRRPMKKKKLFSKSPGSLKDLDLYIASL